jgi:glutathione S-transferase
MPPLVMKLVLNRIERAPMPFFAKPIARAIAQKAKKGYTDPNIARIADYMEAELARSEWFAGDTMTAADIQMFFAVEAMVLRGGGNRPNLARFLERVHALPAYKRALAKGGEFSLLS